jgi:hypothetical protein
MSNSESKSRRRGFLGKFKGLSFSASSGNKNFTSLLKNANNESVPENAITKTVPENANTETVSENANTDTVPENSNTETVEPQDHENTPPPVSFKCDLWQEAFDKLPQSAQKQIERIRAQTSSQSMPEQIMEVLAITKVKQEECEKKLWRVNFQDNEIILRDYAVTIVTWLQTIGDFAVKFAPPPGLTVWSIIKAVMQVGTRLW